MSWTHFITCLVIAYSIYYAAIILIDVLKTQRKFASADQGAEELQFSELEETTMVEHVPNSNATAERTIKRSESSADTIEAVTDKRQDSFEFTQYYQAQVAGGAQNLNDLLQMAQANSIEMKRKLIM